MLYSVDGKIIEVGGSFAERKINSLTFSTKDDAFPKKNSGSTLPGEVFFVSKEPQNLTINYGDGVIESHSFFQVGNEHWFVITDLEDGGSLLLHETNNHVFLDTQNNGNLRNVVFEFEKIQSIQLILIKFTNLYEGFPAEVGEIKGLKRFFLQNIKKLDFFPESLNDLRNLEDVTLRQLKFPRPSRTKIEDGFFENNIEKFELDLDYDLSNPISSNLFKISNWSNSLHTLSLLGCNVGELPKEFSNLKNLKNLNLSGNNILNAQVLEPLSNLKQLIITLGDTVTNLFNTTNFNNLTDFRIIRMNSSQVLDIPFKWIGLKSAIRFNQSNLPPLRDFINDSDNYVDSVYTLTTENAFLDPNSTEAINTGYPNQFRDVFWGFSQLTQSGIIQAPSGFVLGVDNGTPANQGEKIYVLVNNYGHTVVTA